MWDGIECEKRKKCDRFIEIKSVCIFAFIFAFISALGAAGDAGAEKPKVEQKVQVKSREFTPSK